ncbi:4-hydroxy-3-methylbut-2-enyl diphosphate reductase [Tistrella bauzanensis]|uniref:4-hydroxy-3-methylbut-2-enyl diphosphate reductase n=1 Tax=Tistrella arctica TaxID=3133430 RepID=A0ABU9YM72_9PROT
MTQVVNPASPSATPEVASVTLVLAEPRGFCAGVDRAIQIVERAIERFGAPVYVRHEIVHNKTVVQDLVAKGAVFVEELDEVPDDVPVIFSAHGVPKAVPLEAARRKLLAIDATCPLVSKVHREAERHHGEGRHVLLIGHRGHPEVIGTMGQLPDGAVELIETVDDAEAYAPATGGLPLAYATQTTLSVADTAGIVAVLRRRFPDIAGPKREDICYATTNRQEAVAQIAASVQAVLVIGAPNSSNSRRLVETAASAGCANARLIQTADEIDWDRLAGATRIGISAGASAPEILVEQVIAAFRARGPVVIERVTTAEESVVFKLPPDLNR